MPLNSSHFLCLQIAYDRLRQQIRLLQQDRESELNLMRHRINDLTGKLSCSERSLRQAKRSMSKSQERRRSEPGRQKPVSPSPHLPTDFGGKLQDLEKKIGTIQRLMNKYDGEQPVVCPEPVSPSSSRGRPDRPTLSHMLSQDSDCSDSHNMLLRLHELSASVRKISDSLILYCDNTTPGTPAASSPSSSGVSDESATSDPKTSHSDQKDD